MELEKDILNHKENAKDYIDLVNKLTTEQTSHLDNLVMEISNILKSPEDQVEVSILQPYYLKLSTELYMMVDKLKQFEIYSSLAKSNKTEAYNSNYIAESLAYEKKPAATELQIRAEMKAKKEGLIDVIYASAFKTIKNKIDAGNSIADTLKNIIKTKYNIEYSSNQLDNMNTIRG